MRQLAVLTMFVMAVGFVRADQGEPVKCKADGVHLCCNACVTSVKGILGKVEGLTAVKIDRTADDKITFEAKDEKAATAAMAALVKGGFWCEVTMGLGNKELRKFTPPAQKADAGDSITLTGVHVCCNSCVNALNKLFPNATVTIPGKGVLRDVTVSGKGLDAQAALDTMHKAGFTGIVQEKK